MFLPNFCVIVNLVIITNFVNAFKDLSTEVCLSQLVSKGYFVNSKCTFQHVDESSGITLKIVCEAL